MFELLTYVNIKGTNYKIIIEDAESNQYFKKNGLAGYCDMPSKVICLCDLTTHSEWKDEPKDIIVNETCRIFRHESIHAFLYECGLDSNSIVFYEPWATNEEMVDWFAMMGPDMMITWKNASECIEEYYGRIYKSMNVSKEETSNSRSCTTCKYAKLKYFPTTLL